MSTAGLTAGLTAAADSGYQIEEAEIVFEARIPSGSRRLRIRWTTQHRTSIKEHQRYFERRPTNFFNQA